ncbi:hypothetical protein GKZ68_00040 [Hymenobacter sp. BRD128]|uniref:hypothetical protein n=1 Tax=Hymenobacter sp. BRD128 TaxID=2675878 RepID=UPI0015644D1A|nr:hypothetical protein [Hymenobacter sp. BRD128]QKG55170.1 hypothetical protein GKZ68_00040 [Hymenobacter sp. BRD128]
MRAPTRWWCTASSLDLPAFVLVRQGVELWRQQGLPEGEFIVAQLLDKLAVPPARAGPAAARGIHLKTA